MDADPTMQRLQERLRRRAALLTVSEEVLGKAIERCARHGSPQARVGTDELHLASGSPRPRPGAGPAAAAARAPTVPLPQVATPRTALPVVGPGIISPDRAGAVTEPEARALGETDLQRALSPVPVRSSVGLEVGRVIAGYRIERILGAGGMGQVYAATQISMNRQVALKVLAPRLADNVAFRTRFYREARQAGRLHHPHLIAVHDVGEEENLLFYSMELIEGETVKAILRREGRLTEDRAAAIIRATLEALAYAHSQGIVHRDIKPDNLMLSRDGVLKVADLGLARPSADQSHEDTGLTASGVVMGTPHYMPPEQGRDARAADPRSDLYAAGATLYHLVCGCVPFSGTTAMDVLVRAATQSLTWTVVTPSAPMRRFIEHLMAKDPAERPLDARAALDEMARLGLAAGTTGVTGSVQPLRRRLGRYALMTVIVAAVALLLAWQPLHAAWQWRSIQRAVAVAQAADDHGRAVAIVDGYLAAWPGDARASALHSSCVEAWNHAVKVRRSDDLEALDEAIFRVGAGHEQAASVSASLAALRIVGDDASPWFTAELLRLDEALARVQAQLALPARHFRAAEWLAAASGSGFTGVPGTGGLGQSARGYIELPRRADVQLGTVVQWRLRPHTGDLYLLHVASGDQTLALDVHEGSWRLSLCERALLPLERFLISQGPSRRPQTDRRLMDRRLPNDFRLQTEGTCGAEVVLEMRWSELGVQFAVDGILQVPPLFIPPGAAVASGLWWRHGAGGVSRQLDVQVR